jgi:hypothetical protein
MTYRATRYRSNLVEEHIRKSAMSTGVPIDTEEAKTFNSRKTAINKHQNYELMSLSSALGSTPASVTSHLSQGPTDGRYIYYADSGEGFHLRYDNHKRWTDTTAWEKMNSSSAAGQPFTLTQHYKGGSFDGRYVYFAPYGVTATAPFVRYDTTQDFTNSSSWSQMSMSVALKGTIPSDKAYQNSLFDGRYIYYFPYLARTFVRYDTTSVFTHSSSWSLMGISALHNTDPSASRGTMKACFDGQYIYVAPYLSDTLWRYNTTSTFSNTASWEHIGLSAIVGATNTSALQIGGMGFDGRYIYFAPTKLATFLRYDITQSFTSSSSFQKFSRADFFGATTSKECTSPIFDGQYMYFTTEDDTNTFVRYDTTKLFTTSSSWDTANLSTALGFTTLDATAYFDGVTYDGKYIYYAPNSTNTLVRLLATKTDIQYGTTF